MMFMDWNARKRGREEDLDDDDAIGASGFNEHRTKRRIATLPHRQSPNVNRQPTPPNFTFGPSYSTQPAPPIITPADSENEGTPRTVELKSFFSPYSSSPGDFAQSGPPSPYMDNVEHSLSAEVSDMQPYTEDVEMDAMNFSPPHPQQSPSLSGRIPTPIHSSFAPFIRAEKASLHDVDHTDDEALVNRFRRPRRLPSPISEGEMSPSVLIDGIGDMQMEVDQRASQSEHETATTPKKGHQRSKHSLRQWSGTGGDLSSAGAGVKRTFSLGYRGDCEKCRMKVPGHFSHIITY